MNNNLGNVAITEFRRFVVSDIYPTTLDLIKSEIQKQCFCSKPVQVNDVSRTNIIFDTSLTYDNLILTIKPILINYFRTEQIQSLIRNRLYNNPLLSQEQISYIENTLQLIHAGDNTILVQLFNITMLPDKTVYLYL